ncbi:large subunit ribosomal protein L22e [Fistulifera solaris]|uniref:Large ribosomal subunit protein eL22 n=1 Tax=Fistulifera solaris TaxID=1519565 RepID=A0A1Z5K5Q8_FISSO|nr:large subunit ribosomal protein L22e [Fistulifera solaris]|eukprot:GAX21623.1 large subunit ribosomal protein L22e [Fistulifera solaris]
MSVRGPFILLHAYTRRIQSDSPHYSHLQVKGKKTGGSKFVIDCSAPVEDKVLDVAQFEKYLHDRIKINNKTGQLAQAGVVITRDRTKLTVAAPADLAFSKRQLKYLSKRYLKKLQLKNFLRVVAASKNSYEMRYYSIAGGDAEEEE